MTVYKPVALINGTYFHTMEKLQIQAKPGANLPAPITRPAFQAIIVASGTGSRFRGDKPKQFALLHGKAIWRYSLDFFLTFDPSHCTKICLVCHPDFLTDFQNNLPADPRITLTTGGDTRFQSVQNGLNHINAHNAPNDPNATCPITIIHDAARPNIAYDIFDQALLSLSSPANDRLKSTTFAAPVTQTLCRAHHNSPSQQNLADEIVDRTNLWAIQTPQLFDTSTLIGAIDNYNQSGTSQPPPTDETQLIKQFGYDVAFIQSSDQNIKITLPDDLTLLEKIMPNPSENTPSQIPDIRTGQGFDVHKFDTESDIRQTMICGVMVPSPHPLQGHSDADVGIHAIVDAIFGALCIGDIGDHFPPSDPQWKGADSAQFLTYAMEKLDAHNTRLTHIDVTIICEAPKIGPHKAAMKARIADLCALSDTQVNIKATTTEKLGFTGRKEGIATMASVTTVKTQQISYVKYVASGYCP